MEKRLKVLVSAYACGPNEGSEPEVGWQWALQMSRFHDVTVLTRTMYRENIEKELAPLRGTRPLPEFVYYEEGPVVMWIRNSFNAFRVHYHFWQRSAWRVIEDLHQEKKFDLMHHSTIAGFRFPTAIWEHGVPTIWGPVGGIHSIEWHLLPWENPRGLAQEAMRYLDNFIQWAPFHALPRRFALSTLTLSSTEEMRQMFRDLKLETTLMPAVGINPYRTPVPERSVPRGPLKVLFVGSIITLKGIDLAIAAFAEARLDATFTIVGSGQFMPLAKKMTARLGLENKVVFRGRLPAPETLQVYKDYDVFLFPSLHDTGGFAVLEAMASGMPVVCLDCGGPKMSVRDGTGIRVPLGPRKSVISGLAEALRKYDSNRELVLTHGRAARKAVEEDYDWDKKGEQMNLIYRQTATARTPNKESAQNSTLWAGLKSHLPLDAMMMTLAFMLIIGILGFFSVQKLEENTRLIVADTLPDLSETGSMNSCLAEGFNRALLICMARTPGEMAKYKSEMDDFSDRSEHFLKLYQESEFMENEYTLYTDVLADRKNYLDIREHVISLAGESRQEAALKLFKSDLLPAYLKYKTSAENLMLFNIRLGEERGESILTICGWTQLLVAVIGMFLFAAGFLIGFFK
jgi:glycosyltransferase involved in cell wall biosynthesis